VALDRHLNMLRILAANRVRTSVVLATYLRMDRNLYSN